MKRLMLALCCICVLVLPISTAHAEDAAINHDAQGLAILGYDPVAYFTLGRAVEGSPDYEHNWRGARWRFTNEDHLEKFVGEPQRYAPRYGGYCAGAMWRGFKASVDPEAFAIIDGRLYLAYADTIIDEFADGSDESVPTADANWERLHVEPDNVGTLVAKP